MSRLPPPEATGRVAGLVQQFESRLRPSAEVSASPPRPLPELAIAAETADLPDVAAIRKSYMETPPPRRSSPGACSQIARKPVKVFVGTWNTEYGDFSRETVTALVKLRPRVTPLSPLSAARLLGNSNDLERFNRVRQQALPRLSNPSSNIGLQESGSRENVVAEFDDYVLGPALADWLPEDHDVYVVSLQETVGDGLLQGIGDYLDTANGGCRQYERLKYAEYRIRGLGDGAYLSLKSTAIACFVARDCLNNGAVEQGTSKRVSLSTLNGSKGAVAFSLLIHGQVFCFVACHLPAGSCAETRIRAREQIRRQLAVAYSGFEEIAPLDIFHHLIWAGDFNARTRELTAAQALNCILSNDLTTLAAFDEFAYADGSADLDGAEELRVDAFFPTYKCIVGREPSDLRARYNIDFRVRWYKGGRVKERVPSWTDRVLKWSHPEVAQFCYFQPDSYSAAEPCDQQSFLLLSDHAPIGCSLVVRACINRPLPPVLFLSKVEVADLSVGTNKS